MKNLREEEEVKGIYKKFKLIYNHFFRYRNMKERLDKSEFKKYINRLKFGEEAEQEFRSTGEGFGMIGATGKLKISKKEKKL